MIDSCTKNSYDSCMNIINFALNNKISDYDSYNRMIENFYLECLRESIQNGPDMDRILKYLNESIDEFLESDLYKLDTERYFMNETYPNMLKALMKDEYNVKTYTCMIRFLTSIQKIKLKRKTIERISMELPKYCDRYVGAIVCVMFLKALPKVNFTGLKLNFSSFSIHKNWN